MMAPRFSFRATSAELPFMLNRELGETLSKWGLGETLKAQRFTIDQKVQEYDSKDLLRDFFSCDEVLGALKVGNQIFLAHII